ncbi:hypothetical protein MLD38_002960 [Melastoma candidum]|uniref:Uncharacterized protein n=1 Tax=Melastoma candidum TaxID=119954 RepID=A0ACB9S2L2_9MYRT|nr:hypothetical protein MLD38_002960 [Melastoma candidum]
MKALRRSVTSASSSSSPPSAGSASSSWIQLRSVLFVVANSSPASSCSSLDRGRLKSPWSRRKRKHALSPQQWRSLFTPDGRLRDGGVKLLKKVRSAGIHPCIRQEVWPFLLGVYDLKSSKEERDEIRTQNRKKYERLRRRCRHLIRQSDDSITKHLTGELIQESPCPSSEEVESARESLSSDDASPDNGLLDDPSNSLLEGDDCTSTRITNADSSVLSSESSDTDSSEDEVMDGSISFGGREDDPETDLRQNPSPSEAEAQSTGHSVEDFASWRRIIRLDAIRANPEWISYSPSQATVSDIRARRSAVAVGLKDYDHLEASRIFHAARLVAILEAYALYDPEIGYCQGMSDLLSPIVSVVSEDHEAFWCFVGFMKKARHNFRLDEVGIRRQLNIVSKIIKSKDAQLYRHLEKLQAEDCFFVYRMVVVLFRRELTFEQTTCLWEVMWADQAAIRAGIGKSAWSRIRQRAPPTDDLLLYAIAASVLQRRKLIIQRYNSMDEILRECNSMAGQLDVWKLLDDAHNLVVTLHDKIETSFR